MAASHLKGGGITYKHEANLSPGLLVTRPISQKKVTFPPTSSTIPIQTVVRVNLVANAYKVKWKPLSAAPSLGADVRSSNFLEDVLESSARTHDQFLDRITKG